MISKSVYPFQFLIHSSFLHSTFSPFNFLFFSSRLPFVKVCTAIRDVPSGFRVSAEDIQATDIEHQLSQYAAETSCRDIFIYLGHPNCNDEDLMIRPDKADRRAEDDEHYRADRGEDERFEISNSPVAESPHHEMLRSEVCSSHPKRTSVGSSYSTRLSLNSRSTASTVRPGSSQTSENGNI